MKYHEIEAYDLDYGLWVRCDIFFETVHYCNGRTFTSSQWIEHANLSQHKRARLHENYIEQRVMDQKEQGKRPVPETHSHILHFFSQFKKKKIQAQVEFNGSQYIPPPELNISAVKICQSIFPDPKGKDLGNKLYYFHKYVAIIRSSKYEIKIPGRTLNSSLGIARE